MTVSTKAAHRPPIHMIDSEAEALANLAIGAEERQPDVSEMLLQEIGRAHLHPAGKIPVDVVTMLSTVEFTDKTAGTTRTLQLVYPGDADIAEGRISILTPVGAGLIGLRAGQSIIWPDRHRRERILTIEKVAQLEKEGLARAG
ncbi:MAG: nucleoside diphosphate kinase regulator [Novosphingobium sp.]